MQYCDTFLKSYFRCLIGIQFLMNRNAAGFKDTIILSLEYSRIASGSSYQMKIELFAESIISNLPSFVRPTLISHEERLSKLTNGVLYSVK